MLSVLAWKIELMSGSFFLHSEKRKVVMKISLTEENGAFRKSYSSQKYTKTSLPKVKCSASFRNTSFARISATQKLKLYFNWRLALSITPL